MNVEDIAAEIARISPAAGREADRLVAEIARLNQNLSKYDSEPTKPPPLEVPDRIVAENIRGMQHWTLGHLLRALDPDDSEYINVIESNEDFTERFTVAIDRVIQNRKALQLIRETGPFRAGSAEATTALAEQLWRLFEAELPELDDDRHLWDVALDRVRELLPADRSSKLAATKEMLAFDVSNSLGLAPANADLTNQGFSSWSAWWKFLLDNISSLAKTQQNQADYPNDLDNCAIVLDVALGGPGGVRHSREEYLNWWEELVEAVRLMRQSLEASQQGGSPLDSASLQEQLDRTSAALNATHSSLLEMQELYMDMRAAKLKLRRANRRAAADVELHRQLTEDAGMRLYLVDVALRGETPAVVDTAPYRSPTFDLAVKVRNSAADAIRTAEQEKAWRIDLEQALREMKTAPTTESHQDLPLLGLATTAMLLEELGARGELQSDDDEDSWGSRLAKFARRYQQRLPESILEYRTVDPR